MTPPRSRHAWLGGLSRSAAHESAQRRSYQRSKFWQKALACAAGPTAAGAKKVGARPSHWSLTRRGQQTSYNAIGCGQNPDSGVRRCLGYTQQNDAIFKGLAPRRCGLSRSIAICVTVNYILEIYNLTLLAWRSVNSTPDHDLYLSRIVLILSRRFFVCLSSKQGIHQKQVYSRHNGQN